MEVQCLGHPWPRHLYAIMGGKVLRTTRGKRFVAALLGLRHILPPLRYGKTSLTPGTLSETANKLWRASVPALLGIKFNVKRRLL